MTRTASTSLAYSVVNHGNASTTIEFDRGIRTKVDANLASRANLLIDG
jgi:hypothetical protein